MEIQNIEPFKFYSDRSVKLLKRALVRLQQQYEQAKQEQKHQLSTHFSSSDGLRGRAYFSDDDISDHSDHSDLSEALDVEEEGGGKDQEKEEGDNNDDEEGEEDIFKNTTSSSSSNHGNISQKSKKKKTKKTCEKYINQMGTPPSETLITEVQNDTNKAYALTLPTVLFPSTASSYLKDDDNSRDLSHFYQSREEQQQNQDHLEPILSLYNLAYDLSSISTSSKVTEQQHQQHQQQQNVLVILLHSGRFAAAIYKQGKCLKHTTFSRYTVRKGQGGSQSTLDNAKGKAKSIGSQLRRAGEAQLRNDVYTTLLDWKDDIDNCSLFFLSLSKMLQKGFWQDVDKIFGIQNNSKQHQQDSRLKNIPVRFQKGSDQVKSIPLDVGRPSFESCSAVYELLMTCSLLTVDLSTGGNDAMVSNEDEMQSSLYQIEEDDNRGGDNGNVNPQTLKKEFVGEPLTPLHEAAKDGNIEELTFLLSSANGTHVDIDTTAGPKLMTPLHYAAMSSSSSSYDISVDHAIAAKCVLILLTQGHANPCIPDAHHRPPYFLATNDTVRNAFRLARSELGEEMWSWTEGAKVGPALTNDGLRDKREKEAEKKRKQRIRQKERKALERQRADEEERRVKEEEEKTTHDENARRVRAGLAPKTADKGSIVCDFCQKDCKGKRKSQLFSRLDFLYCSSDCMKRHQRELMAAAATARMKGS